MTEIEVKSEQELKELKAMKRKNFWKMIGKGFLLVIECIAYLIFTISLVWLIFDIVDRKKK